MTPCFNNTTCPVDCVGDWSTSGTCSGACEGENGTLPQRFTVLTAAQWAGVPCPVADGVTRSILECINELPCPVPCNYTWSQYGNCTGGSDQSNLPALHIHLREGCTPMAVASQLLGHPWHAFGVHNAWCLLLRIPKR